MSGNKLCILCEKPLSNNDRIVVDSITHTGMKYATTKRVDEKRKMLVDQELYSSSSIHITCYDKIDKEIS